MQESLSEKATATQALQKERLSAVKGKQLYQCTFLTLRTMNSDETFEKLEKSL